MNETTQELSAIIEQVFSLYKEGASIDSDTLPNIDLYVDQVTTILTGGLQHTSRCDEEKIMTKTMINNYTKNHLLPPPVKKKYSKDHILLLIFIYYMKNFLSISDIQKILAPLTQNYFQSSEGTDLSSVYTELFAHMPEITSDLYSQVNEQLQMTESMFSEEEPESHAYLQKFALICMLSLDIYIKKQLIEQIADESL